MESLGEESLMTLLYVMWQTDNRLSTKYLSTSGLWNQTIFPIIFSERLKREQARAEDKFDKRLEIYVQSVQKSRKRPRMFPETDENGDEMVSSLLLTREKLQTEVSVRDVSFCQFWYWSTSVCSARRSLRCFLQSNI